MHSVVGFFDSREAADALVAELRERHGLRRQVLLLEPADAEAARFARVARQWVGSRPVAEDAGLSSPANAAGAAALASALLAVSVLGFSAWLPVTAQFGIGVLAVLVGAALGYGVARWVLRRRPPNGHFDGTLRTHLHNGEWGVLLHDVAEPQRHRVVAQLQARSHTWLAESAHQHRI